jgi:hypothetical protein
MALSSTISGVTSRVFGAEAANRIADPLCFEFISTVVTQNLYIARFPQIVTDICGVMTTAGTGGACTFSFYKCTGTQTPAQGVLLHIGTFNLVGTINTVQNLTLTTTPANLQINVGDRLAVVLTGTATSAVGMIEITVEPAA